MRLSGSKAWPKWRALTAASASRCTARSGSARPWITRHERALEEELPHRAHHRRAHRGRRRSRTCLEGRERGVDLHPPEVGARASRASARRGSPRRCRAARAGTSSARRRVKSGHFGSWMHLRHRLRRVAALLPLDHVEPPDLRVRGVHPQVVGERRHRRVVVRASPASRCCEPLVPGLALVAERQLREPPVDLAHRAVEPELVEGVDRRRVRVLGQLRGAALGQGALAPRRRASPRRGAGSGARRASPAAARSRPPRGRASPPRAARRARAPSSGSPRSTAARST